MQVRKAEHLCARGGRVEWGMQWALCSDAVKVGDTWVSHLFSGQMEETGNLWVGHQVG